jgi:putative nucleotidyltransferase with HDIG domain
MPPDALNQPSEKEFLRIPSSVIMAGHATGFDIYIREPHRFVLFASGHIAIGTEATAKIKESNLAYLYILKKDQELYADHITKNLSHFVATKTMKTEEKAKLLYETASTVMEAIFKKPDTPKAILSAKSIATNIMGSIMSDSKAFISLVRVSNYDYYTYTHCINVALYSIGIGKFLDMSNVEIEVLAHAGILHDIGKSKIDPAITNKVGILTETEYKTMQKHTVFGYELLRALGEKDPRVLGAIRGHHEKLDGSGYPDKLNGSQIPYFAQILAVADIFDALNTKRSYKDPISSFDALKLMKNKMSAHLNQKILDSFIRCMHGELR